MVTSWQGTSPRHVGASSIVPRDKTSTRTWGKMGSSESSSSKFREKQENGRKQVICLATESRTLEDKHKEMKQIRRTGVINFSKQLS